MDKKVKLLKNKNVRSILDIAKLLLKKDNFLTPIVFANTDNLDKTAMIPLRLDVPDHNYKVYQLTKCGEAIRQNTGGKILEALFVLDTYYLQANKKDHPELPVRDNPDRKEAIMIIGRNDTGSKRIAIIQPYLKIKDKYVFEKPITSSGKNTPMGLIDYVFSTSEGLLADNLYEKTTEENKN